MAEISQGKVLVAGGWKVKDGYTTEARSAFILDLTSKNLSVTGNLRDDGESMHSCMTFKDKVYGVTTGGATEIFDPKTNSWTQPQSLSFGQLKNCDSLFVLQDSLFLFHATKIYKLSNDTKIWIPQVQNENLIPFGMVFSDPYPKDRNCALVY